MKEILLVLVIASLGAACHKEARKAPAQEVCTAAIIEQATPAADYWEVRLKSAQARVRFLEGKLDAYKKFGGANSSSEAIITGIESDYERELKKILSDHGLASTAEMDPAKICAVEVQRAREKYIFERPTMREDLNVATAKIKSLEEELALANLTGGEAKVVVAGGATAEPPSSLPPPSFSNDMPDDEEIEEDRYREDDQSAMVAAKEYWDRQIMFARSMKSYLERVLDIYQTYDGPTPEAREALQDLQGQFNDEVTNAAMSPDYYGGGNSAANEQYLREYPGIRAEFNQIMMDMMDLRQQIVEYSRKRPAPIP